MDDQGTSIKTLSYVASNISSFGGIYVGENGDAYIKYTSVGGDDSYATIDSGIVTNQDPVAEPDSSNAVIDHATTVNVVANDSDPDSDSITVTAASTTGHALVAVDSDGNVVALYTGSIGVGQNDIVTVDYTLADSHDATASGTLTLIYEAGDGSAVYLSAKQAEALAGAGYTSSDLGAVSNLIVSDSAENLLALTGAEINALHTLGVTKLVGSAGEVQLSVDALEAIADNGMSLSATDSITISDTAAHFSALTENAIEYLGEHEINPLHVTSNGSVALSLAQAGWLADAGVTFESSADLTVESNLATNVVDAKTAGWLGDNNVTVNVNGGDLILADTPDAISALWATYQSNPDFGIGVTGLRVADTIATMTLLSSTQLTAFASMNAALYISDTADNINALGVSQIQNLAEIGIHHIGISGNGTVHLSLDTIEAFATGDIDFVDDTGVTFTNADELTLDAQDAAWLIRNDVQVTDTGSIVVRDTAANIATLSDYEASTDPELGIGVDGIIVDDTISNLLNLDSTVINKLHDLNVDFLATDTADAINGMTYNSMQNLADLGVNAINVVDSGSITVSGTVALSMSVAGLSFTDDSQVTLSSTFADLQHLTSIVREELNIDHVQLADTAANIGALDAETLFDLAASGLISIDVTDGALTLNADKIASLENGGTVNFNAGDTITISDTIDNLAQLQQANPADYASLGIDSFVISDTGAAIEDMTPFATQQLMNLGATKFDATSAVSLTYDQATLMIARGFSFSTGDEVTVKMSHEAIEDMTSAFVDDLAALGVTTIEKTDGSFLTINPAVLAEMVTKGIEFADDVNVVAVGTAAELITLINAGQDAEDLGVNSFRLVDTGANIAAISLTNIIKLHDLGVSSLNATDDAVTLTTAKAVEYAAEGMVFAEGDIVTVRGAGATIQDLTAEDFTQLGHSNITRLNASDDAITLDASQAGAIGVAGLSFEDADNVKLIDTAENIGALTVDQISALDNAGIDSITVSDSAIVSLTVAQTNAFYSAGMSIGDYGTGGIKVVDTGANVATWDRWDIQNVYLVGVGQIDLTDNVGSFTAEQLNYYNQANITFADDDVLTLADSAENLTSTTWYEFETLHETGVSIIDIDENGGDFTAAQLAAIVDNDMSFAEDDTAIVLKDTGENIADIDADDFADLTFVTQIEVNDTDVSVSYTQAQAIQDAGITFTTASNVTLGDTVANLLTLDTDTLSQLATIGIDKYGILDSGAKIAAITISNIRTLSDLGVTTVDSTDGFMTLTASKAVEFASHLMVFEESDTVTISGKGGSIEDLDAHDVAALGAANVDFIEVTDNAVTLTKAQMDAYIEAGLAFTSDNTITIEMTGAEFQGLSLNDISALDTAGVTVIDISNDAATVTKTQLDALVADDISFADGDAINLQLTSSQAEALSTSDIAAYDAAGVDGITITGGDVTLTKAQADAFAGTGIVFNTTDDVILGMTGAQAEALGSSGIAGYDVLGITIIDLSDNAATLTKAQMDTFIAKDISFASGDAITVDMTGAQAEALDVNAIAAYQAAGVATIDLSDNAATLTSAQMYAVLLAGMKFASGDAITVGMTGSDVAALSVSDINGYDAGGLAKIDLSDNAVTLTKTQMDTFVADGIVFTSGDAITVQMTGSEATALTTQNIAAYDTAGVTTIDLSDNAATLSKSQMDAVVGAGMTFASGDAITLQMTGAQAAGLSTDNIAAYDTAGVAKIDLSDNAATLSKAQMDAVVGGGMIFASGDAITMQMTGAQMEALSANNITAYDAAGLAKIDLTDDAATLTKAQMDQLVTAGVTFASSDAVTVDMTGTQFLALSDSDITAYQSAGLDKIDLSGASVTVSLELADKLINASINFASGDDVHVSLTQSEFASLSDDALTMLKSMGVDSFDVTEDPMQATFAQALAVADANLDFGTDNVVISDSASALLGVDDFEFAKLAGVGVSTIDLTDAHAAISLDIAQALADAGLVFADADDVTVDLSLAAFNGLSDNDAAALATAKIDHYEIDDTAAHIAALTANQIAALGAKGVNAVDLSDDHVLLSAAQIQAFQNAGITFDASDDVAAKGLPDAVADTASTNEHVVKTVDVLANDTKQDGLTLSVTEASVVGNNGTVTISEDGKLVVTYTGADIDKGETAKVTVNYTVSDGTDTDTAQLVVTVRGTAEAGDDIIGTNKADKLTGTSAGETIKGLDGADIIRGGGGDDFIRGGAGKNQLFGGAGNDTLQAGWSNDRFNGGAGADTFIFNDSRGVDRITDFQAKGADHDTISLVNHREVTSFNDLMKHHVSENHGDVVIDLGDHASITLEDVKIADLKKFDFDF